MFSLSVVHERFVVRRPITLNGHVVHGRSYFRVEFRGLITIDRRRNNDYRRRSRRDQPAGRRGDSAKARGYLPQEACQTVKRVSRSSAVTVRGAAFGVEEGL